MTMVPVLFLIFLTGLSSFQIPKRCPGVPGYMLCHNYPNRCCPNNMPLCVSYHKCCPEQYPSFCSGKYCCSYPDECTINGCCPRRYKNCNRKYCCSPTTHCTSIGCCPNGYPHANTNYPNTCCPEDYPVPCGNGYCCSRTRNGKTPGTSVQSDDLMDKFGMNKGKQMLSSMIFQNKPNKNEATEEKN